jgi:hypothetical protein
MCPHRSDILTVDGNVISNESLEYHNSRIFGFIEKAVADT